MFDTMTINKAVAAICGTFLVFLLGNWAAGIIYHVGLSGHGEDHAEASYVIEVTGGGEAGGEDAAQVDFGALLASADIAAGEKAFDKKCSACHKVDGSNATGPHLDGSFGRDIGTVAGFGYSGILTELEGNWTPEAFDAFLTKPKDFAPGTKMTFAGLKKVDERADIVAYLQSLGG